MVYAVQIGPDYRVVHAFRKKSTQGIKPPEARDRFDRGSDETIEGDAAMKNEPLEVIRGSGNVFRDFGHDNADVEQFKALLAAEIIKALDRSKLTVRAAHACTGIAAADFSPHPQRRPCPLHIGSSGRHHQPPRLPR